MTYRQLPRLLFKVDDIFLHSGNRLEAVSFDSILDSGYRVGDLVELRRPDGTSFQAKSGLATYSPDPQIVLSGEPVKHPVGLVFEGLDKQEIPIGSEIWMLVDHPVVLKGRRFEYIGTPEERVLDKTEPTGNS